MISAVFPCVPDLDSLASGKCTTLAFEEILLCYARKNSEQEKKKHYLICSQKRTCNAQFCVDNRTGATDRFVLSGVPSEHISKEICKGASMRHLSCDDLVLSDVRLVHLRRTPLIEHYLKKIDPGASMGHSSCHVYM